MSGTATEEDVQSAVAAKLAVLATCWREPTEQLVDAVESGSIAWAVGNPTNLDLDELRVEYTRLFIGPGEPPCPPYESVYRDGEDGERGPVEGPSTVAVRKWYQEFGVQPSTDHSDLPDHIATELEFAAYLTERDATDDREQFLDEHLRVWLELFLDQVAQETEMDYYEELVATTRAAFNPSSWAEASWA